MSAADAHERLPDPPTYTAVRTMLILQLSLGDLDQLRAVIEYPEATQKMKTKPSTGS